MTVRVHIEHLTVRGAPVRAPERFAATVAGELERLVAERGLPSGVASASRRRGPAVPVSTGDAFARRVAAAVYAGLAR